MTTSILVSHPHATPYATEAAAGFSKLGLLAGYFTGIASVACDKPAGPLSRMIRAVSPSAKNRVLKGFAPNEVQSLGPVELSARLLTRMAQAAHLAGPSSYDAMFVAHDAAVSLLPWPAGTSAVLAYEDAALMTFKRAGRRSVEKIWGLPIPHYATLEKMWMEEANRWPGAMGQRPPIEPEWKKRRKDAEFRLADRISVPSQYTADSLDWAGVRVPIVVTPFGFPLEEFPCKSGYIDGPFTVLSVGTHDLRKGTPYLLEAWKKAAIPNARLRLIGPMKLTDRFVEPYAGLYEHVGHASRSQLAMEYRAADVLVLPTMGDGCPLVVQEAMCSGTPVITTRRGNGPDFITSARDGWVIPEANVDALVDHLRIATDDRDRTLRIGMAARRRAERWTWQDMGREMAAAIGASPRSAAGQI